MNYSDKIKATSDTMIHFLFGSPGNEEILRSFINAVLENDDQPPLAKVWAQNPFNPKTFLADKFSIMDLKAEDSSGKKFAIEFQLSEQRFFINRVLYYWARTYCAQLPEGMLYSSLNPVISIMLIEYLLFPRLEKLHNSFYLTAKTNPEFHLTDDMQIHSLELIPKKCDQIPNLTPALQSWLHFFLYAHQKKEAEMKVLLKDESPVEHAYREYLRFNQDKELRDLEEARQKQLLDFNSFVDQAKTEGMEIGIAEGRVKGRAEGRAEGRTETILTILAARFGTVSDSVSETVHACSDLNKLNSLAVSAATCSTLDDFVKLLK